MDTYFAVLILLLFVLSVVTNLFLLRIYYIGLKKASIDPLKKILKLRKPAIGGFGILLVYLVSIVLALSRFDLVFFSKTQFIALNIAAMLACGLGWLNDREPLSNFKRLGGQTICSAILVLGGFHIQVFPVEFLNILLSFIWIIVLVNSISSINSMNSIAGIVGSFSVIFFLLHFAITGNIDTVSMMVFGGLWASLFAFLFFNWFPAQLRLGDAGAQFLGILLSGGSIAICWNANSLPVDSSQYPGWLVAVLLFLLPLIDFMIVTINRILAGQPIFRKRNDHVAHHLHHLGIRKNLVAVLFSFLSMVHFTAALIVAYYIDSWTTFDFGVFIGYAIILSLTLFLITRRNLQQRKYSY